MEKMEITNQSVIHLKNSIKRNTHLKQSNTDLQKDRCRIGCLEEMIISARRSHPPCALCKSNYPNTPDKSIIQQYPVT